MATKTFYFKNAVPSGGTSARSLQDGGTAPAAGITTTGWTVAKLASGNYSTMAGGSERASGTFSTTATQLDTFSETTAWRSESTYNGTFASGNWVMAFKVRAVTSASSQAGRVRVRVWRSTNADGSGATQITSALQTGGTTAALSTSASQTSSVTWSPGATVTLTNEYLFVTCEWNITTASGNANADVLFYIESTGTITTPDYTPAAPFVTQRRFRFRSGTDAVDTAPTWSAAENTNVTLGVVVSSRLRVQLDNTGSSTDGNWSLWYSLNGGAYAQVTTSAAIPLRAASVSSSADDAAVTIARLTSPGLTFVNGISDENGVLASPVLTEGTYTEIDFGLNVNSNGGAVHNDTVDFRVRYGSTPTVCESYAVTPRVTISRPVFSQKNFRVRSDTDTADATPTWFAAENTDLTGFLSGVTFRLRISFDNTGASPPVSTPYILHVSRNGGAYAAVSSSTFVNASTAASTGSSASITVQRLTSSTGTFANGYFAETAATNNLTINAGQFTELEFGMIFTSQIANGDTFDFRLHTTTNADFDNYVTTPRITVSVPVSGSGDAASQASTVIGDGTVSSAGVTGDGVLGAQDSAVAGTGVSASDGSGAASAQDATVAGTGLSSSAGDGSLVAQDAALAGTGLSSSSGSGALVAESSAASGAGVSVSTGSGALAAQDSTVSGTGVSASDGSGALVAQAAAIAGTGAVASSGTGALASDAAAVAGAGISASSGTGSLVVGPAAVAGVGTAAAADSGTLVAQAATVAGVGVSSSAGAGALAAGAATVAGAGLSGSIGSGALACGAATLAGVGVVLDAGAAIGSGALVAGAATISGQGEVTGEVATGGGGFHPPEELRPFPVVGYGYGILPQIEGEAHGLVAVAGRGIGMPPQLAGLGDAVVGAAGRSAARLVLKAAAIGNAGSRGNGFGMIVKCEAAAQGRHDDDAAAIAAWLLAA